MTVTVKLITEQTTNQLEASVNKAQANGWYPVCGVVWFNARYTQLMAHDSNGTEVPKCNYFLVDSEDGIDFANRVNKLVALNTGASCLSSVQYVNADRSALVAPDDVANVTLSKEGFAQVSGQTGVTLNAGNNATMSTMDATGFTKDTAGEYRYKIDGIHVFFSSGDITKIEAGDIYLEMDANTDEILLPPTYTPTVSNSVATKGYVDNQRPVNAVFRASFTTTSVEATQYVTSNNTPQVVTFNAQAIPNATLGTLDNATGVFTAATQIVGTLAVTCQVRRATGGAAAVTWGFQVETSPDGSTWTPTPGSARYINLRGAGDNNVLQTVNLTAAVDIPAGTRVRITQMTDTSSANVGLVALPAMLGGATAAGLVFSLSTTI